MKFSRCDIARHDLHRIADLIYETEPSLSAILFGKNKDKALSNIQHIVRMGGSSLDHDNIYLAAENDYIFGLTIFYKGSDINKKHESKSISKALDLLDLLRLSFYEHTLIKRLLTTYIEKDQLYISNVCVDKEHRGKGVGRFLLNNIITHAKTRKCTSIILDVSNDNQVAIALYKKMGFTICKTRSSGFWGITTYQMMKSID